MSVPAPAEMAYRGATTEELAERGWRLVSVVQPDGSLRECQVPLTAEEYLHPEEGFHLPNSTFHDTVVTDLKDMLVRRYAGDPSVGVFRDLIIEWENPELASHCPDVFVVFGIGDKHRNRQRFHVADEGAQPSLIVEVVSPRYRSQDRVDKVEEYELAGVQEYVIVDRREQRGQVLDEVLGYELRRARFRPLAPDDDGRILCRTVGLWISLREGLIVLEDAETGERLLSSIEEQAAREAAEARARQEQAARQAAEAHVRDLEARLQALQAELDRGVEDRA